MIPCKYMYYMYIELHVYVKHDNISCYIFQVCSVCIYKEVNETFPNLNHSS